MVSCRSGSSFMTNRSAIITRLHHPIVSGDTPPNFLETDSTESLNTTAMGGGWKGGGCRVEGFRSSRLLGDDAAVCYHCPINSFSLSVRVVRWPGKGPSCTSKGFQFRKIKWFGSRQGILGGQMNFSRRSFKLRMESNLYAAVINSRWSSAVIW